MAGSGGRVLVVVRGWEIRRRTRVVGAFPDGQITLNLATARLRHIAGTKWSLTRYMKLQLLKQKEMIA